LTPRPIFSSRARDLGPLYLCHAIARPRTRPLNNGRITFTSSYLTARSSHAGVGPRFADIALRSGGKTAYGALNGRSCLTSAASGAAPKRPLLRVSTKPTAAIQACRWKLVFKPRSRPRGHSYDGLVGQRDNFGGPSVGPYQGGGPSPDESHDSDAFIEAARLYDL
jgi:hypothetical protein